MRSEQEEGGEGEEEGFAGEGVPTISVGVYGHHKGSVPKRHIADNGTVHDRVSNLAGVGIAPHQNAADDDGGLVGSHVWKGGGGNSASEVGREGLQSIG